MKKIIFLFILLTNLIYAQVGIGTATPNGALDLNPTVATNYGLVPPRVALLTGLTTATVVNPQGGDPARGTMVYNTTNGSGFTPGYYYWETTPTSTWVRLNGGPNTNWSLTGNSGTTAGTNFIGTTDAVDLSVRSSNVERMRVLADGRVSINNASPTATRLFSATADATNTTAIYGTTAQPAPAILAQTTSATSANGAIQGEYTGSSIFGNGVAAFAGNTTAGSDFVGSTVSGVYGGLTNSVGRSFGVFGDTYLNFATRTGGVMGTDGVASGALGYYGNAGSGTSYAVYGFSRGYTAGGTGGARTSTEHLNSSIGLGIYGGVIGGWIKGDEYGTVFSGDRFSSYNIGKVISNEDYIVISGEENKVVSYASTALQPEISSKGLAKLINGQANVAFDKSFSQLIDNSKPIIVTCTPMGETKGIFLAEVTSEGFKIKENQNGNSSVSFTWIAIGEKQISEKLKLSSEILDKDFERNLREVMHDENLDGGKAIWSQNGKVEFGDKAPENPIKKQKRDYKKPATLQK